MYILQSPLWLRDNEPTYEEAGSILGLAQWVKGSGIAMSCGVGLMTDRLQIWCCYGCDVVQCLQL